jgi:bifunctional DNA-binding transcriptional regulator/antitoxin component of YhaV-PrlF toxin-antitoxin module
MRRAQQPPSLATVTSKLQLTIPAAVWKALRLRRGDRILLWEQSGTIIGQPVKTLLPHPLCAPLHLRG